MATDICTVGVHVGVAILTNGYHVRHMVAVVTVWKFFVLQVENNYCSFCILSVTALLCIGIGEVGAFLPEFILKQVLTFLICFLDITDQRFHLHTIIIWLIEYYVWIMTVARSV
jgi:hypothetical protein